MCLRNKKPAENSRHEQFRPRSKYTRPPQRKFQRNMQQARAVQTTTAISPDDDRSSSDENYAYTIHQDQKKSLQTTVVVNGKNVSFLVDTGATVDLIDSATYDCTNVRKMQKSSTKIYTYGSQAPLALKGQFQATLESQKRYTVTPLYVVDGVGGNLLSAKVN